MRQKRYIELVAEEMITLEQGYKNNKNHQFRQRCHALLLSNQGHDMASLKTLFVVTHATIGNWFRAWEDSGIVGLRNQAGQGRKPILAATDLNFVKEKVQENPQHLKAVRETLKTGLNKEFSEKTLKRFLKSLPGRRAVKPLGVVGGSA